MRPLANTISIVLGIALLVLVWVLFEPPLADVGEVPEVAQPESVEEPEVEPLPEVTETSAPEDREAVEPGPSPVRFEELPSTIRVPAIDVDHPLIPVGLNRDGSMEIPDNVLEIGWYEPQGVLPGNDGTAVLAGHVDSRAQGPGAFHDLRHLDVGDGITISDGDRDQEWVVTARRSYDKDLLPIEDIFIDHGEPRLVLVTCGGAFDRTLRSYSDNIVVYAELR